jgi:hypothetical protein
MSLDEYNRHATLGPMAGPATTAAGMAGQQAFQRNNERPAASGPAAPPPSLKALLGALLLFAAVCGAAVAGVAALPEDGSAATVLAWVAALSAAAFALTAIFAGIEALKVGLAWLLAAAGRFGLWRAAVAALVVFVLADTHWYAIEPFNAAQAAGAAAVMASIARFQPVLGPLMLGVGVGVTVYVVAAVHVFGHFGADAALAAAASAVLVGGAHALLRARRRR